MKGNIVPASVIATLLFAAGCQPPPPLPPPSRRPAKQVTPPLPPPPKAGPQMFPATTLGEVDDAEAGHFFARRSDGAMLVYTHGGRFLSRALAADGAPRGAQATDIGPAPAAEPEPLVAALRPAGDGYVLAWVEHDGGRTKVAALALDAAGAARGARMGLVEVSDDVAFVDVLPREGGSLVIWSVDHGQQADVAGATLNAQGASPGAAAPIVTGALAWAAAPSGGAVAAVMPGAPTDGADETGTVPMGKVVIVPLDASGKPKAAIDVSPSPTAQPDVLISEIGGRFVLLWTDMRDVDASVYSAAVDKGFAIVAAPRRATPPTGEQALVAAAGGEPGEPPVDRGVVAWEDVLRTPVDSRQIHLATIGADGSIGKERATMALYGDGSRPDLIADSSGFAAVTLARAWQGGPPPDAAPPWPTFVRFGKDLSVLSAEPVRAEVFGADGVPYLVKRLSCSAGACSTLGVSEQTPSKVALVSLTSRPSEWFAPARREPDDVPPRAASMTAIYSGESIARVTTAEVPEGGHLAAWVTYFAEGDAAARGKRDGGAEVAVLPLAPGAKGLPDPVVISKKAVSVGGIAASPAQGGKKEIAIAWVGRDKGESQLYVTKVDESGKKLAQKKITVIPRLAKGKATSEASDVAIAWSPVDFGEGWIVSWVDTRDGNAEVYAAKVDRSLNKTVPDRRLTDAAGDAAEVQLLVRGKETLVAWSDARQSPAEGKGDIYVTRIETRGLGEVGADSRLAATPAHSRSPSLVSAPGGSVWASWIDEAGDGGDGALRLAVLDDKGAVATTSAIPGTAGLAIVSAAIACGDKACRGIVAKASPEAMLIDAFDLSASGRPAAGKTLLTLPGAGGVDISPVFADRAATSLFFGVDASSGTGRVRRLQIEW